MGAGPLSGSISAGASIYAGAQTKQEAFIQARIAEQEAKEQAKLKKLEGKKFMAKQEMAYLSSGVMLEGSPLIVLRESAESLKDEIRSIEIAGREKAESFRRRGRAAFTEGLLRGSAALAEGFGV